MSNLAKLIALQKGKAGAPAEPKAEPTPTPVEPATKPTGLAFLKKAVTPKAEPKPEPKPLTGVDAEFTLDDLAGMDSSEITEVRPREETIKSGFVDEIEATAPDRDLGELTEQQMGFVELLDGIYPVLPDPELFAQHVRLIMIELQENPEYVKQVSDQDIHVMIRGMRNSMGLAAIRKVEKSRKSGTATKASARKKASVSEDAMAMLDSLLGGGE